MAEQDGQVRSVDADVVEASDTIRRQQTDHGQGVDQRGESQASDDDGVHACSVSCSWSRCDSGSTWKVAWSIPKSVPTQWVRSSRIWPTPRRLRAWSVTVTCAESAGI